MPGTAGCRATATNADAMRRKFISTRIRKSQLSVEFMPEAEAQLILEMQLTYQAESAATSAIARYRSTHVRS